MPPHKSAARNSAAHEYAERVYAGWLGKCIGVRFGAPLENWTYEEIRDNLGELHTYLREDAGKIFKPDDDTSLPMILIRALEDYGASPDLSAADLGNTWLNYLGDEHGTLWWGGYGISTEQTAYRNMAAGIPAPLSGSIAMNGTTIAEQIGGQIFSDIWGLVAPDNPALAADLAEKASSVSHDGNGIYGGRFVAALVSAAFSERDPLKLIHAGLEQIPEDSEYARVINAMIDFHAQNPDDWHAGYAFLKANFGYERYGGIVHIIPNAGVIALALLYGNGDFSRTIQIANMAGWDTDCNVGNVGAIMGVAVGLQGIDSSWREPMNDLLIAASIIGTRNILTIPQCADLFVRLGYALQGEPVAPSPRYHFAYEGSTNNFLARGDKGRPIHQAQRVIDGIPTLQTSIRKLNKKGEILIGTRTYYRPSELSGNYYGATFTPLICGGQTLRAEVYIPASAPDTIQAALYAFDDNAKQRHQASGTPLTPGQWHTITYTLPALENACISEVGVILRNTGVLWETGAFYLQSLDWDGAPHWRTDFSHERAETNSISQWTRLRGYWRIEDDGAYHGSGVNLCETYTGDPTWEDYRLTIELTPLLGDYHGALVRVGGAQRSYAVCLAPDGELILYRNDAGYIPVTRAPFEWQHNHTYTLNITADSDTIHVLVGGNGTEQQLSWQDPQPRLHGQIGLCTWNGSHTRFSAVSVQPLVTHEQVIEEGT